MSLPIFTLQTFNQNSLQPVGPVFVNHTVLVEKEKSGGLLGSSNNSQTRTAMLENKLNEVSMNLIKKLNIQAQKMYSGAVAMIDVKLNYGDITDTNKIILTGHASGTVLIKRPKLNSNTRASAGPLPFSAPLPEPVASPGPVASPAQVPAPMDIPLPQINARPAAGGKRRNKTNKSRRNRK